MKKLSVITLLFFVCFLSFSQDSSKAKLSLMVYSDAYYQYDFNNPVDKERPEFLYNYKKHNQPNINLALAKATYSSKKFYMNLGLMGGTYADFNLAAESPIFRHVYEANIGYYFSPGLSVTAGIMPSHIGVESAIAKDNWNLSRSLIAENSPYYETGIKLNYIPGEKWLLGFLVLNGWQNIKDHNSNKAIGTQLQFKPSGKWLLNSGTFIGNEKPDTAKQLRLFHNFYTNYTFNSRIKLALLFDIGAEKNKYDNKYNTWKAAAVLLQYKLWPKLNTAARIEYYSDKNGIIVLPQNQFPFESTGLAVSLDYSPHNNMLLRGEYRQLNSQKEIFVKDGIGKKANASVAFSLVIFFEKTWNLGTRNKNQ